MSRHFHGLRFLHCHGQVKDSFARHLAEPLRHYLQHELDWKACINATQMVKDIIGGTFDEAELWLKKLVKAWATCVHSTLQHDIRSRLGAGLANTGTDGEVGEAQELAVAALGSLTMDETVVQPVRKPWNLFQEIVTENESWRFFKTKRSYQTNTGLHYRMVSVLLPDKHNFLDITMHRHTLAGSMFYDMADVDMNTDVAYFNVCVPGLCDEETSKKSMKAIDCLAVHLLCNVAEHHNMSGALTRMFVGWSTH